MTRPSFPAPLLLLPVLLPLLVVTAAPAAELGGVTMPDSIEVEGKTLQLNGLGLREATFLKVDVYVAGLYLEQKSSDPEAILSSGDVSRIRMQFVRNVKRKKMTEAWIEGFEKNAKDVTVLNERIDRLNGFMVDMAKGDTMTFTWLPGSGVSVSINGEDRGTIEGEDFARALWSIWLGPQPPNAGLKAGMLGSS